MLPPWSQLFFAFSPLNSIFLNGVTTSVPTTRKQSGVLTFFNQVKNHSGDRASILWPKPLLGRKQDIDARRWMDI